MKNFLFYCTCCFLAILPGGDVLSQEADSSRMEENYIIHSFDSQILSTYRADEDFNYNQLPASRQNILSIIFNKFLSFLIRIFGNQFFAWLVMIVLIIVGLVGLGFALYGLFGIGKTIPVYSDEARKLPYSIYDEDIKSIDFPTEIENALAEANYRKAIRLLYLYSLRILSERKCIEWKPSKTNYDYVTELQLEANRNQFQEILYYFEYVWYGDFQAEKIHYDSMAKVFFELKKNLAS
jgi:hypothetical protein